VTSWDRGQWLNAPPAVEHDGDDLLVTAARGSDLWQRTSYGFQRDSGHALLEPVQRGRAVEVTFVAGARGTFEQAGLLVRLDEQTWVKAGVEHSDGVLQLSAVVTSGTSDWSTAPVPSWADRSVTVRASLSADALTVRARVADEPFRLVRLAPLPPQGQLLAGPYCCAPQTDGFRVRFTGWSQATADAQLH
jgi:regulation of enolase protein 1 (concanavalin A-like superfamily)